MEWTIEAARVDEPWAVVACVGAAAAQSGGEGRYGGAEGRASAARLNGGAVYDGERVREGRTVAVHGKAVARRGHRGWREWSGGLEAVSVD